MVLLLLLVMEDALVLPDTVPPKHVQTPPPSAPTMGTPTQYAQSAQMLMKVCYVHHGQIAPAVSTSLQTAQAARTVYAHLAVPEHIPLPPTLSLALRGPVA